MKIMETNKNKTKTTFVRSQHFLVAIFAYQMKARKINDNSSIAVMMG